MTNNKPIGVYIQKHICIFIDKVWILLKKALGLHLI